MVGRVALYCLYAFFNYFTNKWWLSQQKTNSVKIGAYGNNERLRKSLL